MPLPEPYICIMQADFEILKKIVRNRRTTKAASMNGKVIPDRQIEELLELANWAPTHGRTEPWKFFVYSGEALKAFGEAHARLYLEKTPLDKQNPGTPSKLMEATEQPSHLIVSVMNRGSNPKIPVIEEIAATSAAVQNILLGAGALGLAAIWNSGGMTHHPAMKSLLGLREEDIVIGLIYLGYSYEPQRSGNRSIPLEEKVIWRR